MTDPILEYLSGWIRTTGVNGVIFVHGDWRIHLIRKHDILLTGKGFTGEMRFYDAAKKIMEMEKGNEEST